VTPASQSPAAIVRHGAGLLFCVRDAGPDLAHVWIGLPVKANGKLKKGAVERLVRRIGAVVVKDAV